MNLMGLFKGDPKRVSVGQEGDLLANVYGKYYELAIRGMLFHAATAVTGVAPGTAIGTTAAYALENPAGSNKNVVVIVGRMGYVSGTLGAGVIHWVSQNNPSAAATTGTAITPVNAKLDGPKGVAKPFTTATVPASPAVTRVFGSLEASLATTADRYGLYVLWPVWFPGPQHALVGIAPRPPFHGLVVDAHSRAVCFWWRRASRVRGHVRPLAQQLPYL